MSNRRKQIDVSLPLEAINDASVDEKLIRTGHLANLHQWWSRNPQLVALPKIKEQAGKRPRQESLL